MRIILNPPRSQWSDLCRRPAIPRANLERTVIDIMERVRTDGDAALLAFAQQFDKVKLSTLRVSAEEFDHAGNTLDADLRSAIRTAYNNIHQFHLAQQPKSVRVETMPGVVCQRVPRPISPVGLYIPGGGAPLFSTVLMLGIPARIAGCEEVILCTPPARDGSIHPAILFTATMCGIRNVFKCGGAQAIAAMASGTASIPAVHKIFGPGNQYVTCAKQMAAANGTAIDLPAGPSEVLVIADDTADPAFVAADLLSQAEHGEDSQVVLVTNSEWLPAMVLTEVERQLETLPRQDTARKSLQHSLCVVMPSLEDGIAFTNTYAPEHLIMNFMGAEELLPKVVHAGSVFIGPWTPESAGDYASGTNHTLPTGGYARSSGGVSVDSFTRYMTLQSISADGLKAIGPVVETMASAESLDAHARAVTIRLNKLS